MATPRAQRLEAQLTAEVKALTARAEAADRQAGDDGMDIPEEIVRRDHAGFLG